VYVKDEQNRGSRLGETRESQFFFYYYYYYYYDFPIIND